MDFLDLETLIPLSAVVLSLSLPIVAVVMGVVRSIKKNNNEHKLREAIITNHTDPETAQLLIQNQEPKSNKFVALRWGCILLGIGLGAAVNAILHLHRTDDIFFWLILAAGCGIGFLASFIVETKMQKKDATQQPDNETDISSEV